MNCHGIKSHADVDILIATTAVEQNLSGNVVTIAKDIDLLVLLTYHYTIEVRTYCVSRFQVKGNSAGRICAFLHRVHEK